MTTSTTSPRCESTTTGADSVRILVTARDTGERMAERPSQPWQTGLDADVATVEIKQDQPGQTIIGFGGAFTEAGAHALSELDPARREEVLRAYFDPEHGLGYTLCRTHINSCDFSLGNYAYCETPGDVELAEFSIARDHELLIPFIRDAMQIAGTDIRFLASPWSPPAWMKTNGKMNDGGQLIPEMRSVWARYFTRYIRAYAEVGIPIWAVTVQNEPRAHQTWDSCLYTHEEQRDFVRDHLGPTLEKDGLGDVKILVWDHNKDEVQECADIILSDPEAARYIWGVAFHWYGGDHFDSLAAIHRQYPDMSLVFSEGCQENGVRLGSWELGERYAHAMIGDLNHWTTGWIDWNMVLNHEGGPNHVGNFCDAPIIVNAETDTIHYQNAYFYIGHFSRHIRPEAVRLGVEVDGAALEATSARNPDGSVVTVVLNPTDDEITFCLRSGERGSVITLPARSIGTLTLA